MPSPLAKFGPNAGQLLHTVSAVRPLGAATWRASISTALAWLGLRQRLKAVGKDCRGSCRQLWREVLPAQDAPTYFVVPLGHFPCASRERERQRASPQARSS